MRSLLPLLSLGLLLGCDASGPSDDAARTGPPRAMCTVPMLSDLVAAVAGNEVEVDTLLARGTDPHIYQPTTSDATACRKADAVFYVGLRLEGALAENLAKLGDTKPHVVAVGPTLPQDRLISAGAEQEFDPHVWMDVALWAETIPAIVETLSAIRPEAAATFEQNAARLRTRLAALDGYVRDAVATLPEQRRVMITAHDAFGYFGQAYGMEVAGVQGVSTESEAGIKDIENLLARIRQTGIGVVFAESSTSDATVAALVEAAQAEGLELELGGPLYSDSTGPEGTWEGTYIGMVDHNVAKIVGLLGGDVPNGGFRATEPSQAAGDRASGDGDQ